MNRFFPAYIPGFLCQTLTLGTVLAADEAPDPSSMKVPEIYAHYCATCHGANFEGGQGGSLVDGEWKHGSSDAEIFRSIAKGNLELGMTPWEGVLSAEQMRGLVIFIQEKEKEAQAKGIQFPTPEVGKVTKTTHEDYVFEMVVEEGLKVPWSIAFLPEGSKLITEKEGRLRLVSAEGELHPEPINDTPEVLVHGQGGLLDVALHPDYGENGWIYLAFSEGKREEVEGERRPKVSAMTAVVRGRIRDHAWVDQEWIFKAEPEHYGNAGVHFGTRLVFDDKGYLYFIVGERGGLEIAQDLSHPAGKIFRLHDDGRVPEDNPFVRKEGALPGIWSYGHRNPQGMAFDPRDGMLYATEHGPRGGDELNVILKGRNYGWPVITYGMNYNGTPMTSETHRSGMEQPVTYWVPSIAACGLAFYEGEAFPRWQNQLFAGGLKQQVIRRLRLIDQEVVEEEVILKDAGRVRDVRSGPDGLLYVVLNSPDCVVRLAPARD